MRRAAFRSCLAATGSARGVTEARKNSDQPCPVPGPRRLRHQAVRCAVPPAPASGPRRLRAARSVWPSGGASTEYWALPRPSQDDVGSLLGFQVVQSSLAVGVRGCPAVGRSLLGWQGVRIALVGPLAWCAARSLHAHLDRRGDCACWVPLLVAPRRRAASLTGAAVWCAGDSLRGRCSVILIESRWSEVGAQGCWITIYWTASSARCLRHPHRAVLPAGSSDAALCSSLCCAGSVWAGPSLPIALSTAASARCGATEPREHSAGLLASGPAAGAGSLASDSGAHPTHRDWLCADCWPSPGVYTRVPASCPHCLSRGHWCFGRRAPPARLLCPDARRAFFSTACSRGAAAPLACCSGATGRRRRGAVQSRQKAADGQEQHSHSLPPPMRPTKSHPPKGPRAPPDKHPARTKDRHVQPVDGVWRPTSGQATLCRTEWKSPVLSRGPAGRPDRASRSEPAGARRLGPAAQRTAPHGVLLPTRSAAYDGLLSEENMRLLLVLGQQIHDGGAPAANG